jgi:hypothetical protein
MRGGPGGGRCDIDVKRSRGRCLMLFSAGLKVPQAGVVIRWRG